MHRARRRRGRLRSAVDFGFLHALSSAAMTNIPLTRRRLLGVLILTLVISACGGDGGPTTPSGPQYPQVAGTYSGPLTVSSSIVSDTLTASMRMVVVQAGAQLTLTGSLMFLGETVDLPAVTGALNETGFFTATAGGFSGTVSDETCGTLTTTSATLTFSGSTARITESATTEFCGTIRLSGTLTR